MVKIDVNEGGIMLQGIMADESDNTIPNIEKPEVKMSGMVCTIGALLRKNFRNYLNECMFKDAQIEYIESKYLSNSVFTVKGRAEHIERIGKEIDAWIAEMEGLNQSQTHK